jgi:hypothetical protein
MGEDRLRDKPELFAKRQAIHGHNACFGGVRHASMWMMNIADRRTVTPEARELANKIWTDLSRLEQLLKTRVGP